MADGQARPEMVGELLGMVEEAQAVTKLALDQGAEQTRWLSRWLYFAIVMWLPIFLAGAFVGMAR